MIHNQWYAVLPSKAVRKNTITGVRRLGLDLAIFGDNSGNSDASQTDALTAAPH